MKCSVCDERFQRYDKVQIVRSETPKVRALVYHADHDIGVDSRLETALRK